MPRSLPPRPSLELLRKHAKDLLRERRLHEPHAKLADAQHAVAVEYGCRNWAALKARVEAMTVQPSLAGVWRLDATRSLSAPEQAAMRATLHIVVTGDTVTITDVVTDASGREERNVNTVCVDGHERAAGYGYVLAARWRGGRILETTVTKDGRQVSALAYEVAPDGRSLAVAATSVAHAGYPAVQRRTVFERLSGEPA